MKSLRILIVDDSFITPRILRALLTELGHEIVAVAESGEAGVAAYRQFRPDLVTMDMVMPDMDGIEATRRIIADDPEALIIMATGSGKESMLAEALAAGANGCLTQPFTSETLADIIEKAQQCRARIEGGILMWDGDRP